MPNSVEWAVAWFATTRIGAVAVPLNTFYKASELGMDRPARRPASDPGLVDLS